MLKSKFLISVLALSGAVLSSVASAQVYVGGSLGASKWSDSCAGKVSCDTSSNTYKLLGGYNINKNFAIEGSYFSLGKMSAKVLVEGVSISPEVKGTGFGLAGIYNYDFTEDGTWSGFAKLGVAQVSAKASAVLPAAFKNKASFSHDTNSTQAVFGLGVTYKINKEFSLRAELEQTRAKIKDETDNVRSLNVSAIYSF